MRTRSRRRIGPRIDSGHVLFGGTGWLFADLMLAIAMAFLVATTIGFPLSPHRPPPSTPHHKLPAKHAVIKPPQPALDFKYVTINLRIDPAGLLANDPTATASIRNQVLAADQLKSRCTGQPESGCVGLVLLFGGDPQDVQGSSDSPGTYEYAQSLDSAMWNVLQSLGQRNLYFRRAINRNFVNIGAQTTTFELNIYVFKVS